MSECGLLLCLVEGSGVGEVLRAKCEVSIEKDCVCY